MRGAQGQAPARDTYDLAVGLRHRLAEAARPQTASVESQLQSAVRERLGSDHTLGGRDRSHRRVRRA